MDRFKATSVTGKFGIEFLERQYVSIKNRRYIKRLKKSNNRYCRRKLKLEANNGKDGE